MLFGVFAGIIHEFGTPSHIAIWRLFVCWAYATPPCVCHIESLREDIYEILHRQHGNRANTTHTTETPCPTPVLVLNGPSVAQPAAHEFRPHAGHLILHTQHAGARGAHVVAVRCCCLDDVRAGHSV